MFNNIDLAIKQMKYIINEREIDKNHKKVNKDKENYFYNLWKAMDPTPKTEFNELMDEYYMSESLTLMKILKVGRRDGNRSWHDIYIIWSS